MDNIEEILHTAPSRIQQNRTSEAIIQLRDPTGVLIPKSTVNIRLIQHSFLFGSNAFGLYAIPNPEYQRAYEERFDSLLNYATLPFYWGSYESRRGEAQAERLSKMAGWCQDHNILAKGHPLVWHEVFPQWALNITDEEALQLLEERVRHLPLQFSDLVGIWDVVNEATVAHRFDNAIGRWISQKSAAVVVDKVLRWARQSNPQAILLYNDFNLSPDFEQLVGDLLRLGAPLDAIGIQSHMHQERWPLVKVWQVCEIYARIGLPLHFTELTILSGRLKPKDETDWHAHHTNWKTTPEGEQTQAEYGEAVYTLLYSHPAVRAITWWDFADHNSWQDAPAGFLREDMSPKPLYTRLHELIHKEWATNAQAVSDDLATVHCRCTFGKHEILVNLPSGDALKGEFWFQPGDKDIIEINLKP